MRTKKPLGKAASRTTIARRVAAERRAQRQLAKDFEADGRAYQQAAALIRRRLA